jgi:hypothetical protein
MWAAPVTNLVAAIETPHGSVFTHQGCLRWRRLVVTWRNSEHVYYRVVWRSASRYLEVSRDTRKRGYGALLRDPSSGSDAL